MPIYEYEALNPNKGCKKCRTKFEVIQGIDEEPIARCPDCGGKVRKLISRCRAAIVELSDEHLMIEKKINDYESQGMWSHAAELADKQSERINDSNLRNRALENYKKAGYNTDSLEKHGDTNNN